jgi:hypothetical protein
MSCRGTSDRLETHRARHFPIQAGAGSVWRAMLEDRAEAEAAHFERGVLNLVTPRAYLQVMLAKSFAGLASDGAEIGPDLGLRAAAELHKLAAVDDEQRRWAQVHAKQAQILAAFKTLPPQFRQQVLDTVDNRTPPPGARLAVIEGGVATDEDFDSGDDDDDFDDED